VLVTRSGLRQTIELAERHGRPRWSSAGTAAWRRRGVRARSRHARSRRTVARGRYFDVAAGTARTSCDRRARPRHPRVEPCSTTSGRCCSTRSAAASRAGVAGARRDPARASQRYGARATSWCATPGSRRSTTSRPRHDPAALAALGVRRLAARPGDSHRRPSSRSYHRGATTCRRGRRSPRQRPRRARGGAAHARAGASLRAARPALADRARLGRRRAEPDRGRGSRRLGPAHDEPRGRRPRGAGVHDVAGRIGAVDERLRARAGLRRLEARRRPGARAAHRNRAAACAGDPTGSPGGSSRPDL